MSGRGLKDSKSLLSLSSVFELSEASAYRITPTYVFAFRKAKKGTGIVPVRIKHGNVKKYWDDLADPKPGSPLANTVIGTIPRYYKAATDLRKKDPTKKISDLMTPDGGAPEAKPLGRIAQPDVPMMPAAPAISPEAAAIIGKLGYKPKTKKAKAVELLLKNGNHLDAAVELAGGDDDEEALEKALDLTFEVVSAAESAGLLTSEEGTGDEEGVYFITLKPTAVSPIVQPVAPKPAPVTAPVPKPDSGSLDVSNLPVEEPPPPPTGTSAYDDFYEKAWQKAAIEKGLEALKKLPVEYQASFVKDGKLSHMGLSMLGAAQNQTTQTVLQKLKHTLMSNYSMKEIDAEAKASVFLAWAKLTNIPLGVAAVPEDPPAPPAPPAPTPEPATHFAVAAGAKLYPYLPNEVSAALFKDKNKEQYKLTSALLGALAVYKKADHGPLASYMEKVVKDLSATGNPQKIAMNFLGSADKLGLYKHTMDAGFVITPVLKNAAVSAGVLPPSVGVSGGGVVVTPSPVAAPPVPVPQPEPVKTEPVKPAVPVEGSVVGGLSIPPLTTLKDAGDAMSLGGLHAKRFLVDGAGNKYLFKPSTTAQAAAGAVYADLAAMVLGKDKVVPVIQGDVPGLGYGSVQPMVPGVVGTLKDVDPTTFTPAQLEALMGEKVMDWALSSHDAKAGNVIKLSDGQVIGIDKEQAFKHLGDTSKPDKLDTTYNPNPSPQLSNRLFDLYKSKKIKLPLGVIGAAIDKIDAIPDDVWMAKVEPYLERIGKSQGAAMRKKKADAILARKKAVRADFEKFLTGILQYRGELALNDKFVFPKAAPAPVTAPEEEPKKKKKDMGDALPPPAPMGSVLSPPQVVDFKTLTATTKKLPGSTGQSYFYMDPMGKKYAVKLAVARDGSNKPQPYRVAAQEIFSQVSAVVRPGKSLPVAAVPGGVNGLPATVQPWVDGSTPVGKNTDPESLTPSEKKDIAEEHLLDWLLSQHDTHGNNLLKRPDGTIISIDKEQGFKYFMGDFKKGGELIPPDTKLSVNYHPNKTYGEDEAYYNVFWRGFGAGKVDFDPTVMKAALERIEGISESDYTKLLSKFTEARYTDTSSPQAALKVAEFLDKATARKKNIRADFEEFISDLYKKRTGKDGGFTFADGWQEAGATPKKKAPAKKKKKDAGDALPAPATAGTQALASEAVKTALTSAVGTPKSVAAQQAVDGVAGALFPASGTPLDPSSLPLWSELVDKGAGLDAVGTALNAVLSVPASDLMPALDAEAKKAHPDNLLLQQAAVQAALNRKNEAKAKIEKKLTELLTAKTGDKGKFTLSTGWVPFGKLPPPIVHKQTKTAAQIATDLGFVLEQSFNGDSNFVALKIKGSNWAAKQKEFEAATGLAASGPAKEKPSQSQGVKVFIPFSKAEFDAKKVETTWTEQPPAPGEGKVAPTGKTPKYFPTHEPALPLTTTYADLENAHNAVLGEAGKMFPSDGTGVENNNIAVQRVFDKQAGKTKFVLNFKLRPELWMSLNTAGIPGTYKWYQGSYDSDKDQLVGAGRYGSYSIPTRLVDNGADVLHYSVGSPPNDYNPMNSGGSKAGFSATDWGQMGAMYAEVELQEGETIPGKLKALLDKMQPGLGDKVFRPPTPEDAEVTKLARIVWSQLPSTARIMKQSDFTLDKLREIVKAAKVPQEYLDAKETEVFPGYRSYVVPGRWKSKAMTLPDGSPKVRFMLTSSATPKNIVKNLANGPGPLSQNMRLQTGIGLGNGKSMGDDRQTGGSELSMWRLITASKSSSSINDDYITGNISGPYRYLIPPDELDRLDAVHYLGDAFGNQSGQGAGNDKWINRKKLEDAVDYEQNSPLGRSEVDFRKGVSSKRVLRVLCTTEAERNAVIEEAKKQGVTEFNGIPVEDFVVATGNRSMEDIYQNFVKPMGY